MGAELLHYRPWRGSLRAPAWSLWPIARIALTMILRRRLFWIIYILGLMVFLLFFFGQYLLVWAETQTAEQTVRVGMVRTEPAQLIRLLREVLKLNGTAETYRNFFWYQGYIVMVLMALAGAILVGNDFQFGSLPFYLSKPLNRWHYLFGKCAAVGLLVNLMTTLPAIILFIQYGLLDSWDYFIDRANILLGIVAYGGLLTVCLSLLLVATATWLRRTVPLIMAWTTLLFFLRLLSAALVDGLQYDPRWRLIDVWHNTYLVGNVLLGLSPQAVKPDAQPAVGEAALVLFGLSALCLSYLSLRIQAVEVVR